MTPHPRILLVDDQPGMIQVMAKALSNVGQLTFATSGQAALDQARKTRPDLILLDAEMPGMTGYEVCVALKKDVTLANIPVIFVTSHKDQEHELRGLDLGAADFLSKPVSEPLLLARVKTQLHIKHLTDELRRMALIDALTETTNRRGFDAALTQEWLRCQRAGDPIALLMVDVDHFKNYNDHYGHPAGDASLRQIAMAMRQSVMRPADLVARFGGEEFAVLLPHTGQEGAMHVAAKMLEAVTALQIPHATSPVASHVTVSIGVACQDHLLAIPGDEAVDAGFDCDIQASDLIQAADSALYMAKAAGRARACFQPVTRQRPASPAPQALHLSSTPPCRLSA